MRLRARVFLYDDQPVAGDALDREAEFAHGAEKVFQVFTRVHEKGAFSPVAQAALPREETGPLGKAEKRF